MMQSSPLNLRRAVIWMGRLVLGGIFIYAGCSKVFLPNHIFWPFFFLKFSISTNIANFALGRAAGTPARAQRVPQGQAIAVVQIDVPSAASANAAVEALRKVEAIASVRLIELGK